MSESNEEIRYILKFYYKKGEMQRNAVSIEKYYYIYAVSVRVGQIWFKRFQSGNFDQDRHISIYDVAEELIIDHKTVLAHLKKTGYTKKGICIHNIWVPHELTERNLMNRIVRKRSWSKACQASQTVAKPGLTRNKVILCVWWDWKGIIHYELLPPGRTIDSELYSEQLMRLKQEVERKRLELINRRGVVFHHDNARPHTSLATQQKIREFGWEVLMHPPYSPDLAPSDFHLLTSRDNCQNHLSRYFDQKPQNFYSNWIMSLQDGKKLSNKIVPTYFS
ncbi:hypothetical protein ABMA27_002044 [Loxostege sticticalis]|uniref:Transposase n=1 Tax=Loxostege sticticalis TaxID=481309 RepID=A0ABR3HWB8_LOXSC